MELPKLFHQMLERIIIEEDPNSELFRKANELLKILDKQEDPVVLLMKALYGLRQAGREWNEEIDKVLRELGLTPTISDPCLYFYREGNELSLVFLYVDDFLIASKSREFISRIKSGLSSHFTIKDMGQAENCLGIEINQSKTKITLSQKRYTQDIIKRFGMQEADPVVTPLEVNDNITSSSPDDGMDITKVPYRELIGS